MTHLYLGNWRDGGPLGPVIPSAGGIRCSALSVAPDRPAFFAYDEEPDSAPEFILDLAQDLTRRLSLTERSAFNTAFGITLPTNIRLADALEFIFVDSADVTEATRWKPLYGDFSRGFGCWLGSEYLSFQGSEQLDLAVATFRREYLKIRPQVQEQRELDVLRKWTNIERRRMGVRAADLLPPEYVDDGELRASTTFTDDFEDASIGAAWTQDIGTWNESGGNLQQTVDDEALDQIRASGAGLSGADYFAEVQLTGTGGGSYHQYAGVRLVSGGDGYIGGISSSNAIPQIRIYTSNGLGSKVAEGGTRDTAWYYQLDVSGTNLTLYGGAAQNPTTVQCSGSDATYSASGHPGHVAGGNFGTRQIGWFQADDGVAAGETFNASPVALTLTPVAPTLRQRFFAVPVGIDLTPQAASYDQTFKASPVVTQFSAILSTYRQTFRATPVTVTLTPLAGSPHLGQLFSASPVGLTITAVPSTLRQTVLAQLVQVTVTPVAGGPAQRLLAQPLVIIITPVAGTPFSAGDVTALVTLAAQQRPSLLVGKSHSPNLIVGTSHSANLTAQQRT